MLFYIRHVHLLSFCNCIYIFMYFKNIEKICLITVELWNYYTMEIFIYLVQFILLMVSNERTLFGIKLFRSLYIAGGKIVSAHEHKINMSCCSPPNALFTKKLEIKNGTIFLIFPMIYGSYIWLILFKRSLISLPVESFIFKNLKFLQKTSQRCMMTPLFIKATSAHLPLNL